MKRLLQIVDNYNYILDNCFQHQLFEMLQNNFQVTTIELGSLKEFLKIYSIKQYDVVLSCLKLRTFDANIDHLKHLISEIPLYIYEQDPWCSYIDNSPYKGSYDKINCNFNVKTFLTPSKWWSDKINSHGIKSTFFKLGLLQKYCDDNLWENRQTNIGFKGQLHSYRKSYFEKLASMNINVVVDSKHENYKNYLRYLSNLQIFTRDEPIKWICDGEEIPLETGAWPKEVEVAGRGCFIIKRYHDEAINYEFNNVPTTFLFKTYDEVKNIYDNIMSLSTNKKNDMIKESVAYIKNNVNWLDLVQILNS